MNFNWGVKIIADDRVYEKQMSDYLWIKGILIIINEFPASFRFLYIRETF